MYSRLIIKDEILKAVKEVTGISCADEDANLIDREIGIIPADFIYIFDLLEKRLQIPVHNIFTSRTFDVMTVNNLSNALLELKEQTSVDAVSA